MSLLQEIEQHGLADCEYNRKLLGDQTMKYQTWKCRGFYLPTDPTAKTVGFMDVLIAKGCWDEIEDSDDERIFYYADNQELQVGDIVSDGFVLIEIN
jgi:hypothetical protein